jgi:DNA-binding beta-propeller fold protein YncE
LTAQALPVGKLTQLAGTTGCVSETGTAGTCANGKALEYPQAVTVSPDGTSVYVASENTDGVAVFRRNTTSGQLSQLAGTTGCVSEDGSLGLCADGKALDSPQSVAVSADGKHVYVTSVRSDAIAVFRRNVTSGALTQLAGLTGCISEDGSGGLCADGKALKNPESVVVSADGNNLYVASESSDAVAVFKRNTTSGALTQLVGTSGCISEDGSLGACVNGKALDGAGSVAVSADGNSVYVVSAGSNAIAAFRRNTTTAPVGKLTQLIGTAGCVSEDGSLGTCVNGKALDGPFSVAVSADGKSVYVASLISDAVAVFARSTATAPVGKLTQLAGTGGCVSEDGSGGLCANVKALSLPAAVAVSPDGKSVYVGSTFFNAVAAFSRSTSTAPVGKLTQLAGAAGCIVNGPSPDVVGCTNTGKALEGPAAIAVSANSKSVYVASAVSDAVAAFARDVGP